MPDRHIDRERTEWAFHPLADLFPMMDETALADLAADIKAESQREPIYLWQDQIIDGRNRYEACKIAGVEPVLKKIEFPGGESEALNFVVSRNLKRRHLTIAQRSVIAAKVANMRKGERTDLEPSSKLSKVVSQGKAAEMLSVSRTSVQAAKAVLERGGPELVAAVEAEEISLREAAEIARRDAIIAAAPAKRRAEVAAQDARYERKEIRAVFKKLTADERQRFLAEIGDDIVLWLSEFASPAQRRRVLLRVLNIEHVMEWLTARDANQWKNAFRAIDHLRSRKAQADSEST